MTFWTDEVTEHFVALVEAGRHSYGEIGRIIKKTRNACIGRAHRLGLPPRSPCNHTFYNPKWKPKAAPEKRAKRSQPKINFARTKAPPSDQRAMAVEASRKSLPMDASLHLALEELKPGQCRFPYGDGPYRFCALPVHQDSSYCATHHKVCHQPQREFSSYMRLEAIL